MRLLDLLPEAPSGRAFPIQRRLKRASDLLPYGLPGVALFHPRPLHYIVGSAALVAGFVPSGLLPQAKSWAA